MRFDQEGNETDRDGETVVAKVVAPGDLVTDRVNNQRKHSINIPK